MTSFSGPSGRSLATGPVRSTASTVTSLDRAGLVAAVQEEFEAWSGRARRGVFRRWLRGAISVTHLNVLTVLEESGPIPIGKLAEALDVSVASATGIVTRMEERGLVSRTRGTPDDLRIVLVAPTDAGARIFEDLESRRAEHLGRLLDNLTQSQLVGLLEGIHALRIARERHFAARAPDAEPATESAQPTTIDRE